MLKKLIDRKSLTVLGINSGTSADGLDLALTRIGRKSSGGLTLTNLFNASVKFPPELRARLHQVADTESISPTDLALTDESLGGFIGAKAQLFIKNALKRGLKVDLIASHGQTIRHHPQTKSVLGRKVNATLQIGSPERISASTGRIVVSNFRQAHTALGGEGAPITTGAVYHALAHRTISRLVINIGGIANLFYIPTGASAGTISAYDIGPGNVLLDLASQTLFDQSYDKNGKNAKQGTSSKRLLSLLTSSKFFTSSKTVSTGRERYNPSAFERILKISTEMKLSKQDILATLTEFTATSIVGSVSTILNADRSLIALHLSGGGARNNALVRSIKRRVALVINKKVTVGSLKDIGFHPDFFEAVCFSILGFLCIKSFPSPIDVSSNRSNKTGSGLFPILGRISQAPVTADKQSWTKI